MLQEMFEEFRPLFDNMPTVKVNERGSKTTKCVHSHAKYTPKECPDGPFITFSPRFLYNATPAEIEATLKHEMIHAWLEWKGLPHGHTKNFFIKYVELGLYKNSKWHTYTRSWQNIFNKTLKEHHDKSNLP